MTSKTKDIKENKKVRVPGVTPDIGKTKHTPDSPPSLKQLLTTQQFQEAKFKNKQLRKIDYEARRAEAEPLFREIAQNKRKGGMEAYHEWATGMHEMFWDLVKLTNAFNALYGGRAGEIGPMATLALFVWNEIDEKAEQYLGIDIKAEVLTQLEVLGIRDIKLNKRVSYNVSVDEKGKLDCKLTLDGVPCVHKDGEPNGFAQAFERGLQQFMQVKGWNFDESNQTIKKADGTAMNQVELDAVMVDLKRMDVNGLHAYMESYHNISMDMPTNSPFAPSA